MSNDVAKLGITFDDVLIEPRYSDVVPSDVDVTTQRLFDGYRPLPDTYDELCGADGRARPDFARALAFLASCSVEEFARFQSLAERSLLNQGVTFSVYLLTTFFRTLPNELFESARMDVAAEPAV